jgi:hypothetical protein
MGIELAMKEALASQPEAVALACMDTRSGLLLGVQMRADVPRDDVETAAFAAVQLCSAPRDGSDAHCSDGEPEEEDADESLLASSHWVHAYARVPTRRDLVVVGLARGDANIALLHAWIRQVAAQVGPRA